MTGRRKIALAATVALLVFSGGVAGATHGGDDTVFEGSIVGYAPKLYPCAPAAILAGVQGVTQFIVDIPEATWNHEFTLTSPISGAQFTLNFWAKDAGGCREFDSRLQHVQSGVITEGATHALLQIRDKCCEWTAIESDFMLTIDNDGAGTGDENVTVGIGFTLPGNGPSGTGWPSTAAACQLSVALGANGFIVLDAAVAKGCIKSYSAGQVRDRGYPGQSRYYWKVRCINEVCDAAPLPAVVICPPVQPACMYIGYPRGARWNSPVLDRFSASSGAEFRVFVSENSGHDTYRK